MTGEDSIRKKTLRELREDRGMSREELAVALHVPFSTLVNLEMGRNQPRVVLAEKIYQFFGVPIGGIEWVTRPKDSGSDAKKVDATAA